jgi:hypothetical protein
VLEQPGSRGDWRHFTWRSDADVDLRWEERTYALSQVTEVDLRMSYGMGEAIAHTIVSFGFDDAPRLAFSIEIRKEAREHFSALTGFFTQYELALIAADERDVVRVRRTVRGEDVRLYRLNLAPRQAARLLRVYLDEAHTLARTAVLPYPDLELYHAGVRYGPEHPSGAAPGCADPRLRLCAQRRLRGRCAGCTSDVCKAARAGTDPRQSGPG